MKIPVTAKVAGVFIVIALVVVGVFVWRARPTPTTPPADQALTSPAATVSSQAVLSALQAELSVEKAFVTLHQNWFSESLGRRIPLTGQYFAVNAADSPFLADQIVSPAAGGTPYEIRGAGLTILKEKIAAVFATQDFQENSQNTTRDEASSSLDETLAFEKGEVACLVKVRTLDPVATFFCGQYDPDYEALQAEFIPVLNPKNDPDVFVEVGKVEGNYARGGVGGGGGGAEWWAVKTEGGQWQVVWQGQTNPPCSLMEKHQFPKKIYQECDPNR